MGDAPFAALGRDEKLALLINAYNAFTLQLILEHWDGGRLQSIRDIPADQRWEAVRWNVGGRTWSLDQIEHEQIRPKFRAPRIHFALVCAAIGCPPLRSAAYTGTRLDAQLTDQARYVHAHDRWFRYPRGAERVALTRLYDWYAGDFRQVAGSVLDYAARHADALQAALAITAGVFLLSPAQFPWYFLWMLPFLSLSPRGPRYCSTPRCCRSTTCTRPAHGSFGCSTCRCVHC